MIRALVAEVAGLAALALFLATEGHFLTICALLVLAGTIVLIDEVKTWIE